MFISPLYCTSLCVLCTILSKYCDCMFGFTFMPVHPTCLERGTSGIRLSRPRSMWGRRSHTSQL